jgi:4-hydroxybenzoate polyprenyltransferase
MTPPPRLPEVAPGVVADAAKGNWVDLYAPPWARPYLRLSRADRPIGTWLLFIPCLWGLALAAASDALRAGDLWIVLGCGLGAFLMRGAGCTWNDLTDRHIDAQVARTRSRPLPSGQVSPKQAVLWMVLQALLSALILFSFNRTAIALGIASLALVAVYPFAKRVTWWPQVFLGLAFNWGVLVAWAAHAGTVTAPAVLMWLGGIVWTLFYDTIYAHQDKDDDALIGVKSTARLFGDQGTARWMLGFLIAALALLTAAVIVALAAPGISPLALLTALAGVWAFGLHLGWQLRHLDTTNSASCLYLFRSNRDAGLILALFLAGAALL